MNTINETPNEPASDATVTDAVEAALEAKTAESSVSQAPSPMEGLSVGNPLSANMGHS